MGRAERLAEAIAALLDLSAADLTPADLNRIQGIIDQAKKEAGR